MKYQPNAIFLDIYDNHRYLCTFVVNRAVPVPPQRIFTKGGTNRKSWDHRNTYEKKTLRNFSLKLFGRNWRKLREIISLKIRLFVRKKPEKPRVGATSKKNIVNWKLFFITSYELKTNSEIIDEIFFIWRSWLWVRVRLLKTTN